MTSDERSSIENGIWLCANCATEIDKDPARFPVSLLRQWKTYAEAEAEKLLSNPSYRRLGIPRSTFAPPLDYQRQALKQIIDHLRRSGVRQAEVSQLARLIPDDSLRDGINFIFEPLTIESVSEALDELVKAGQVILSGNSTLQFPDLSPPSG